MNYIFKTLLRVSITIVFLIQLSFSYSQATSSDATIDSTTTTVPKAIPIVDVFKTIEEIETELKLYEKRLIPQENVLEIDSLFPEYVIFIDDQKLKTRYFVKANPNRQKIDNLITKWAGFYDFLGGWESTISSLAEKNTLLLEKIEFKKATWELTYNKAKEENIPKEILTNITNTWDHLKVLSEEINNENNHYLKLESRINKQKLLINEVIEDLNNLKSSGVYDLFYLRHPPLWRTSFSKTEKDDGVEFKKTISKNINGVFEYLKNNENTFYLYFILVGLTVLLFLVLKKNYLKHEFNIENGQLQKAKGIIINHNTTGIIFLSLVIANEFFNNTPMLFADILFLFTLIAAIPMIKPFLYKRFKNIVYYIVVFFILDSSKTYIWFSSPQYRLFILVEALIVVYVLLVFTRPYLQTRVMKIGNFGLLLIRMTPVIYSLAAISIVSNFLGYTNLTDLTLKIIIQSGQITVIFYGILMVAGAISTGLFHFHFSRNKLFDDDKKLSIELKTLKFIRFASFAAWMIYFLTMVDLYEPLSANISEILLEPYKVGSINFTIGAIVSFILILTSSFIITSFISFLIDGNSMKFLKLPKGVPAAMSLVIRYFIIAFGFVFALSSLGIDLSNFNLMAGALGLGIGFGLQTVISNFVSGLILVFERPILVGDTVEVNNLLGIVSKIGVRASNVRTFDGAEVVVPNNNLIANDLINWTLSDNVKRIEIHVGTTYGSDPNQIIKVLSEVASKCEFALKDPAPTALFEEFGDSSLNFRLLFWVHYENSIQAKSNVSIGVYNIFKELGIEIPFPQQDIYIKDLPKKENENLTPNTPKKVSNKQIKEVDSEGIDDQEDIDNQ